MANVVAAEAPSVFFQDDAASSVELEVEAERYKITKLVQWGQLIHRGYLYGNDGRRWTR